MVKEIKRDYYLEQLIKREGNGLIKIVTGIRRCGKSYLLRTLFKNHLLENGIYAAPSQFEAMFVSFAHTEDDIEKTCQVIESFK